MRRCRERLTELAIEVKRGADNAALLRGGFYDGRGRISVVGMRGCMGVAVCL